jgi:REP element-mobilizing transposase RayT
MNNPLNFPNRQSFRLKGFDYSTVGTYFITICCHNRFPWFGQIQQCEMYLNANGKIVENSWLELAHRNQHVQLSEYIVMPDHFHGLISIHTINQSSNSTLPLKPIGRLIAAFKTTSCRQIREIQKDIHTQIWQRNYWERIVRTEQELQNIRQYIQNNPRKINT